ncbi:ATP-grasp domain-containing protein [Sorangium sp. So ce1097]|uniref:ATP-grasp domain-containing protein n=1 Tax=Sorangium sp. So ce1097 TaxID=3133330 RepID=UPI003F5F21CD
MVLLFCSDPLVPRQPDSAFAGEADAARDLGLDIGLIDFEALVAGDSRAAVRRVPEAQGRSAVYRGWMLRPSVYADLHGALAARGVRLVNDPDAYAHGHHLPGWYPALEGHTPRSVWLPVNGDVAIDDVMSLLRPFGDGPVLLKDFVKSRKHEWAEACFIPAASDRAAVERVVRRFIELQGSDLEGGLVFREFVELAPAGRHPKSGMPLAREHRIFFLDGEPVASLRYWDEAEYEAETAAAAALRALAARVKSRFFTLDVAELLHGGWTVIEVGDGQVSGLPDHADRRAFYQALAARLGGGP